MRDRGRNGHETMADVSHGNPHTGSTLGDVFRRGVAVADGGRDPEDEVSDDESADHDGPTADDASATGETVDPDVDSMADVDHTSPNADVNEVWTRGPGVPEKREADR